ncbi:hypothetical protein [Spirosoma sordidisoli]|uniref:Uncharacterized protein n=1 Tax=Spirosoma sordidisoli TaxID=2502893 RepID=A0A4Q2UPC8_9BACT|nr:hypothetical protein [Spirosoma sordidisoli]RYC69651.1 hypothetical protein EQG79_13705 [Spirosoma sordidisoli]
MALKTYSLRPYIISSGDNANTFDVDATRKKVLGELIEIESNDFLNNPVADDVDEENHWYMDTLSERVLTAIDTWKPTSTAEQVLAAFYLGATLERVTSILKAFIAEQQST